MLKASLLPRAGALAAAIVLLLSASARAASGESTPIDLSGAADQGARDAGGGGSIVRTIVGLAVVIGVIYGVAWVLRQVKAGKQERATGAGLASVASVPLGSGRSVHLVRAGNDLVLVGVAEHGVTPLRTYDEEQARGAGLLDEAGELLLQDAPAAASPPRARPALRVTLEALRARTVRR